MPNGVDAWLPPVPLGDSTPSLALSLSPILGFCLTLLVITMETQAML